MPFIVFQSFIGKRHELGRMGRLAGEGLWIVVGEGERSSSGRKLSDSRRLCDSEEREEGAWVK